MQALTAQLGDYQVAAIAVVNQRETLAVTDASDRLLCPALLWLDERRQHEAAAVAQRVGRERLQELTGKPYDWSPAIYNLAWMARAEPALFERIAHVYDPHARLVRQLTGEFATSWASADPFGAFDIQGHRWAEEVLAALPRRMPGSAFAIAAPPGTVLGHVHRQASLATGGAEGIPVVAEGGDAHIAATAVVVEHLGGETFTHAVTTDGQEFTVKGEGHLAVTAGQTLAVSVSGRRCHLFTEAGTALSHLRHYTQGLEVEVC